MRQAVADAYFYMQEKFMGMRKSIAWWPDRNWADSMYVDQDRGFRFEKHDDTHQSMQIDKRGIHYFYGIYWPNKLSKQPATQYLMAMGDKNGKPLVAGKNYTLQGNCNWDKANPMTDAYIAVLSGELEKAYGKVKVPTMGIWSTGDRYTGEKQMQETTKYMAAEWRYERVENSTHWTMLDQPEETNRLLLDWLQKN